MKFFLHSQCVACHKIYKKGQFCPNCLKCHLKLDDKTLVECRSCEKWVHKSKCINIKLNIHVLAVLYNVSAFLCRLRSKTTPNKIWIHMRAM